MEAPRPPAPAKDTGLPPGVRVGPLGRRFLAFVIDSVVPAIAVVLILVSRRGTGGASVALLVIAVVLGLAWAGVCWQQLAVRAASPGMRVLKLQLVGFFDGRPIGWGRVFLRWLIFAALAVTGLGLLLLLVSIFMSPRQQGWHDRAASAVVIVERALPPRRKPATSRPASARPAPAQAGPGQAGPGQRGPAQQRPAAIATATAGSGASGRPAPVASPSPVAGDPALAPELAPVAGDPDLAGDTDPGTV